MTEYIFHFVKDNKQMKFYMDRVMEPAADTFKQRIKSEINNDSEIVDGVRNRKKVMWKDYDLVRPDNVFRFNTASSSRDNTIRHPAPFHRELPEYFINLLTDEGDVVLDVFSGIGTTGLPCRDLNRQYIGYELNPKYAEFSIKRIEQL